MNIWLTAEDLAARWKVGNNWVYANYRKLKVPYRKIGGNLRFKLTEIVTWEEGNFAQVS